MGLLSQPRRVAEIDIMRPRPDESEKNKANAAAPVTPTL